MVIRLVQFILMLSVASAFGGDTLTAKKAKLPVIQGPLPVTATSYPFGAAERAITPTPLAKYGYIEEEFLVTGLANVYDWDEAGKPKVRTAGAKYTTRVLVRRPVDPQKFSGTVIVNPMNPTFGFDLPGPWSCCAEYMMGHGDVFVGFTFKPVSAAALKKFDPQRYSALSFANPLPTEQRCTHFTGFMSLQNIASEENGLAWDLFTQIARLLRAPSTDGLLPGFTVQRVLAYGYSQDAAYLRTYVNRFQQQARLADGRPAYDGYLIAAGSDEVEINQCSVPSPSGDFRIQAPPVPVMVFQTEMDFNSKVGGIKSRRPDSDAPGDRYRQYELAGAPHIGDYAWRFAPWPGDAAKSEASPQAIGMLKLAASKKASDAALEDVPQQYVLRAMLHNLDEWVQKDTPPPAGVLIQTNETGGTAVDKYGNAMGGLRLPHLDVPTASYSFAVSPGGFGFSAYKKVPFEPAELRELYRDHQEYVSRVKASVKRLVEQRYLLPEDANQIVAEAQNAKVP